MFKTLVFCFTMSLALCAHAQRNAQGELDPAAYVPAAIACPPGMAQYCERRSYNASLANSRVNTARKMLEIDRDSYGRHPDTAHSVQVTESEDRLKAAIDAHARQVE